MRWGGNNPRPTRCRVRPVVLRLRYVLVSNGQLLALTARIREVKGTSGLRLSRACRLITSGVHVIRHRRSFMNTAALLNKARLAVEAAGARAVADEKAARIAKETSRAAKTRLKYARKLTKLSRRAAKSAKQKAAEALDALERARKKLKKLEKRFARSHPKRKASRSRRRAKPIRKSPAKRTPAAAKPVPVPRDRSRVKRPSTKTIKTAATFPAKQPAKTHPQPKRTRRLVAARPRTAAPAQQIMKAAPSQPAAPGGIAAETQSDSTRPETGDGSDVPVV